MFEDQNVELLPARTVMTCVRPSGGGSRRTTNVAIGGNGGNGGAGGRGGIGVNVLSGNSVALLTTGNQTSSASAGNGGAGGAGGAGGSATAG